MKATGFPSRHEGMILNLPRQGGSGVTEGNQERILLSAFGGGAARILDVNFGVGNIAWSGVIFGTITFGFFKQGKSLFIFHGIDFRS